MTKETLETFIEKLDFISAFAKSHGVSNGPLIKSDESSGVRLAEHHFNLILRGRNIPFIHTERVESDGIITGETFTVPTVTEDGNMLFDPVALILCFQAANDNKGGKLFHYFAYNEYQGLLSEMVAAIKRKTGISLKN